MEYTSKAAVLFTDLCPTHSGFFRSSWAIEQRKAAKSSTDQAMAQCMPVRSCISYPKLQSIE
eukprot:6202568-Pleurochrysis_carterae.AAC.2